MSEKDGGQAFPQSLDHNGPFGGLTVRDYFAAKALHGLISVDQMVEVLSRIEAESVEETKNEGLRLIAKMAYELADALLAEREKDDG